MTLANYWRISQIKYAIAHKDYSSGIPIQIRVYDDKLSIWNSTQLPEEWTIKRLTEVHSSQPYNPAIANCFFRAGFIESWGRGTLEIIRECMEYGILQPSFRFDSGVWVEFNGKEVKGSSEKMSGKTLALITQNQYITIPEIAENLNVTERTIERAIRELKSAKMIERIGPDKGGYWKVIE